jgi:hypothetical protein
MRIRKSPEEKEKKKASTNVTKINNIIFVHTMEELNFYFELHINVIDGQFYN